MDSTCSVRIPAGLYREISSKAKADDRTIAATLRRMIDHLDADAVIDEYLASTSKVRVLDRWRKAGGGK